MKSSLIIMAVLISLAACASIKIQSEGNQITKEQAEGIKPGLTARNIIIDTFGNPTKTESKADGRDVKEIQ